MTFSKPSLRLCFFYLLVLFLAASSYDQPAVRAESSALDGKVEWVYDGDTLDVSSLGKVRLLGIDVPEREPSTRDRFFLEQGIAPVRLRQIHDQATAYVINIAKGQEVDLSLGSDIRDRHGRLLAYVILSDGRILNRLLLEKGFAVVYRRFDFDLKDDFLAAEAEARRKGLGLWKKKEGPR